jgi:hypothetical protein
VAKFTTAERSLAKSILATLSIKKISDAEVIKEIERQTKKSIGRRSLYDLRQSIKKESYEWYKTMREGRYEYVHEFRERISEIMSLQQKHHQIIDNNEHNPQIQQTSLAELHRLSITLSNLFDVAPTIINGTIAVPTSSEIKSLSTTNEFIV